MRKKHTKSLAAAPQATRVALHAVLKAFGAKAHSEKHGEKSIELLDWEEFRRKCRFAAHRSAKQFIEERDANRGPIYLVEYGTEELALSDVGLERLVAKHKPGGASSKTSFIQ